MDIGDFLYILIPVGLSIVSAVSKKRKAAAKSMPSSERKSVFDDFLNSLTDANDQPEPVYESPEEPFFYTDSDDEEEEPVVVETAAPKSDMQEKLDSLYSFTKKDETEVSVAKPIVVTKTASRHSILDDLRDKDSVKKAVIYAEIFERKF